MYKITIHKAFRDFKNLTIDIIKAYVMFLASTILDEKSTLYLTKQRKVYKIRILDIIRKKKKIKAWLCLILIITNIFIYKKYL